MISLTAPRISANGVHRAPEVSGCTTRIRPPTGWQLVNVRELWQYRELLYFLAWRDVKVRYKQTALGAAWAILQPLLMMVVFSIFFGRLAHVDSGDVPYPLFAFAGLLPWTFFATSIAKSGNSVVGSERLITKIYFPRLAIPFAGVVASLVDFFVACAMLAVLMVWYQAPPSWNLALLPGLIVLFTLAAMGVGALLAALNVAYRDFRYVIPFLVQLWMFATPSVYMRTDVDAKQRVQGSEFSVQQSVDGAQTGSASNVEHPKAKIQHPSLLRVLLSLNPITGLVASFRAAVLGGPVPWSALAASASGAVLLFAAGCLYFRCVEDSFADII
ncbi:MAG TPA: ABC transporter permease [Pirellulales bacterium]|nr:ABC transporter permease [Pirellulales bacterium]